MIGTPRLLCFRLYLTCFVLSCVFVCFVSFFQVWYVLFVCFLVLFLCLRVCPLVGLNNFLFFVSRVLVSKFVLSCTYEGFACFCVAFYLLYFVVLVMFRSAALSCSGRRQGWFGAYLRWLRFSRSSALSAPPRVSVSRYHGVSLSSAERMNPHYYYGGP